MRLEGKVALVTGAGGGIGRAVTRLFAQEGARVVASDVRPQELEETVRLVEAEGHDVTQVVGDVGSVEDVARLVTTAVERFGRLDVVVHCAGLSIVGTVEELTPEEFERSLRVNVMGSFLVAKYAIPELKRQRGSMVLVGSTASLVGAFHLTAYGAAKAAVLGIARSVAADYAAEGVRVNCLCPGPTDTPLLRGLLRDRSDAEGEEAFLARVPIRRFAAPEEIARAALFLCSDEASYVTGAAFTADGGFTTI